MKYGEYKRGSHPFTNPLPGEECAGEIGGQAAAPTDAPWCFACEESGGVHVFHALRTFSGSGTLKITQ